MYSDSIFPAAYPKMSYSEGFHQTARSPNDLYISGKYGLNLLGLFLYDGATLRCRYN